MKAFNANGSTFKFGDPRVADINDDGKIDANDRTIIGDSYPGWTGSMSNRVTYHDFDLSGARDGEVELHVHRRHAAQLLRPLRQHRRHGLLDADESDEQEPGADHRRHGSSLRGDAPLHRRLALAHPQHHGGLHARISATRSASVCTASASTSRRRIRTSTRATSASIPKWAARFRRIRTLLLGTNIVW